MKDHKGMVESWDRMAEHLAQNDVDITKEKVTLGVPLKMNGKTEKFHRQRQSQRDAHAQLPRALRRAGKSLSVRAAHCD